MTLTQPQSESPKTMDGAVEELFGDRLPVHFFSGQGDPVTALSIYAKLDETTGDVTTYKGCYREQPFEFPSDTPVEGIVQTFASLGITADMLNAVLSLGQERVRTFETHMSGLDARYSQPESVTAQKEPNPQSLRERVRGWLARAKALVTTEK